MWFEDVLFFIAAIGALAGALGVVLLQNPFYSVLSLVGHLLGLAVLFLLLNAEFVAAAKKQVTEGACKTPETRDGLLKKGVTLRYAYFDKDKQPIASVEVAPSDCGF